MKCLTLVHGGGGNAYAFLKQIPFFASQGFFVISVSIRGWGASLLDFEDPEYYSADYLAQDVAVVLDAIGAPKTAMLGHSVGGYSVARFAMEYPSRLTHAIFSSTFYGLVDDPKESTTATPYISRYIQHRQTDQPECERLAQEIKATFPAETEGASHPSCGPAEGRFEHPNKPDNFSAAFRQSSPDLCWMYDAFKDGNEQVLRLKLNQRFKVLHAQGSVSPTELRAVYAGPILFTLTECDSLVHWECVYLVAAQIAALSQGATHVHWLEGELHHAPNIEDPDQYNRVVLNFLRGVESLEKPVEAAHAEDDATAPHQLQAGETNASRRKKARSS